MEMLIYPSNLISGVMFSVLAPSVVDHGIEPRLARTKDYEIGARPKFGRSWDRAPIGSNQRL
jgi:hypothetical protein